MSTVCNPHPDHPTPVSHWNHPNPLAIILSEYMFSYIIWLCHGYIILILASLNPEAAASSHFSVNSPPPPGWVYVRLRYLTFSRIYIAPASTWTSSLFKGSNSDITRLKLPVFKWVYAQLYYWLWYGFILHLMLLYLSDRRQKSGWVPNLRAMFLILPRSEYMFDYIIWLCRTWCCFTFQSATAS